eukprot:Skav213238  [mRNA]  locus=scaffold5440:39017:42779:+ [translate_table: standard]
MGGHWSKNNELPSDLQCHRWRRKIAIGQRHLDDEGVPLSRAPIGQDETITELRKRCAALDNKAETCKSLTTCWKGSLSLERTRSHSPTASRITCLFLTLAALLAAVCCFSSMLSESEAFVSQPQQLRSQQRETALRGERSPGRDRDLDEQYGKPPPTETPQFATSNVVRALP